MYQSRDNVDFIWNERNGLFESTAPFGALNITHNLTAGNGNLREQFHQLKGLFSDEDGVIAQTLEDASATASRANQFWEAVKVAEKAS